MDCFDFYWFVFVNIGEQFVLNKEFYVQGDQVVDVVIGEVVDDQVFGYQEVWVDYCYKFFYVIGEMRLNYIVFLDFWYFVDDYFS